MKSQINNIIFNSKKLNILVIGNTIKKDISLTDVLETLQSNITYKDNVDDIEYFLENKFDVMIINVDNNPNIEFIEKINDYLSIIIISAFDNFLKTSKVLEIDATGYLITPIDNNQFYKQLTKVISKKKTNETNLNTIDKLTLALNLVREYEYVINESNILSRANLDGEITYVNDKFCEVSGYTRQELLGQNHNIIRHRDTPKLIFTKLWNCITKGDTWKGIVKNKNKSGKSYWVDSTIVPMKDKYNNIVEYMAIRHDLSELFSLHKEMEDTQREIIYKMGEVGETRSKETGNHVKRVAQYSRDLAILYGLDMKESDILFTASPMHDIGKVGIPDAILKKPGKLTEEEFVIMKEHAQIGYNILKGSNREILKAAAIVSLTHHEKWDGNGYPNGLIGKEIHIYGRITAIADVFDALGSNRVYKKAWEDKKILKFLIDGKGKHFEPKLIELFLSNIDLFLETRKKYQDT